MTSTSYNYKSYTQVNTYNFFQHNILWLCFPCILWLFWHTLCVHVEERSRFCWRLSKNPDFFFLTSCHSSPLQTLKHLSLNECLLIQYPAVFTTENRSIKGTPLLQFSPLNTFLIQTRRHQSQYKNMILLLSETVLDAQRRSGLNVFL